MQKAPASNTLTMSSAVNSVMSPLQSYERADKPLLSHDNAVNVSKRPKLQRSTATLTNVNWKDNGTRESTPTPSTSLATNKSHPQHRVLHPGRWIKDKWTHTTHEERELDQIAKAERIRHTREAMEIAMATGEKQLVGRDANGQDVYVEPPSRSQYNASGYSPYGYGGYGLGLGLDALLLGGLFFW